MRNTYANIIRTHFRRKLVSVRTSLNMTQCEMSQNLSMSLRSYSDLENGKCACSTTTFVLFLIKVCPDPIGFIEELRKAIDHEFELE